MASTLPYALSPAPPTRTALRAGPLRLCFEPDTGMLRYVRHGDRDVLHGIYVAVRDRDWKTLPPRVSGLTIDRSDDAFRLAFDVDVTEGPADFGWHGTVTGDADGTLRFEMDGIARSTFLRNRIGLCVLHPHTCAGRSCTAETTDGARIDGAFPAWIAPHQPFIDLRAFTHEVAPGLQATVRFEGEVFEMEDQRNWTDASFKTYGTPLRLPFPVEIAAGTRVHQAVTLSLHADTEHPTATNRSAVAAPDPPAPAVKDPTVVITVTGKPPVALPRIGLGMAGHDRPLGPVEQQRLKALRLSHLRVDLFLADPAYPRRLQRAANEADELDLSLEAVLHLTDAATAELAGLRVLLASVRPRVASWLILHVGEASTAERWVRAARHELAGYDPDARFGGGTNANFTELNRDRPPEGAFDVVFYSVNPQCHASDAASLVETLVIQGQTVANARRFAPGAAVAVTPVTLKPRFNPDRTGPAQEPSPETLPPLPPALDARQPTLFGAGWTLGSLRHLAEQGAGSVTYFETTGAQGVMELDDGTPWPDRSASIPGGVFPLYHVLADAGAYAGGRVRPLHTSDPLRVEGLALTTAGRSSLLLANLTPDLQPVRCVLPGAPGSVAVRSLEASNRVLAMQAPETFREAPGARTVTPDGRLERVLPPFAYLHLDYAEAP